MKVLTATAETQGLRPNDYTWCVEGEVVTPVRAICSQDEADPDGGCGCGRAFAGLNSHRATTTAMVRDLDGYSLADLTEAVRSYREQAGWTTMTESAGEEAEEIAAIAAEYITGVVLEIRLEEISARSTAP
jgi:hypothetical protein